MLRGSVSAGPPLADPQAWKASIIEGFTAVADAYDADGGEFVQRAGAWLVEVTGVAVGAWVLDVGCGKGAAALAAARAAGLCGHVTGIDLAVPMLERARDRARAAALANVSFKEDDASAPGWPPGSFDVILAASVIQFLPRTARVLARWRELLMAGGTLGIAWSMVQDARWEPVLAAVDAYVPDGVPGYDAFMRRPPFGSVHAVGELLTGAGYVQAATVARAFTLACDGPQQWWEVCRTQGPWAVSWRHIAPSRLRQAKQDAFRLLENLRGPDGTLTQAVTFAVTTARKGTW